MISIDFLFFLIWVGIVGFIASRSKKKRKQHHPFPPDIFEEMEDLRMK